jgi:hypothetical protein
MHAGRRKPDDLLISLIILVPDCHPSRHPWTYRLKEKLVNSRDNRVQQTKANGSAGGKTQTLPGSWPEHREMTSTDFSP